MECCLVQDEGVVYMDPMKAIAPGANFDMQISYALIPQDQKYIFSEAPNRSRAAGHLMTTVLL